MTEGQGDSIIKIITNLWLSLVLVLKNENGARDLDKNPRVLVARAQERHCHSLAALASITAQPHVTSGIKRLER